MQTSDWYLKTVSRNENSYTTIYEYQSGEPVRVPSTDVSTYLSKTTKSMKIVDGLAQEYGEVFNPFVLTKEKCLAGTVVSSDASMVAPSGKTKGKRQKRGKRGKRR